VAVSSGGGRCSGGGAHRWPSTGRQPRQMNEAADSVLQRVLAEDSGSVADMAWLGGARRRCAVASTQRLEWRWTARGRAEWASARRLLRGRGEGKRGFASAPRR
jgi:hypothetical protein